MLKWGGITQVSFNLEVKAICDTIQDCLCPIEDHFDVIMRKNTLNIQCASKHTTNRCHKSASKRAETRWSWCDQVTSFQHPSHKHTQTHTSVSKCGRVSGCASKIAPDTKTLLAPKEGEVEPSTPGQTWGVIGWTLQENTAIFSG